MYAAEIVASREGRSNPGGEPDPELSDPESIKLTLQRKTYKQNWPAYNEAQTKEKERFQVLLHDLCRNLEHKEVKKVGRPRVPLSDVVFATAFKVYSTVSTRRFATDLKNAHQNGYISRPIHYNSICAYLERKDLTPVLHDLIERSSLPLKAVETNFAVDSTGFSTSRFVRWFDEKYGVTRSGHDWVKVHVMSGVKTNVVTATEIRERSANDAPFYRPLVTATARNFEIKEVSADKAYSSLDNIEVTFDVGGTPFIPFKSNASEAQGGLWERMLQFYLLRKDEFMTHYHQRSNAESTFNMIKAKFRDHVRSRTDDAMKNEVLAKVLCHNLCCVIQSQYELGIEPVFWSPEKQAANA
jgi:transposase